MQSPLPITGPLTLGDLLDRAFRLYRARFGVLMLTAAIFIVPLGIISGLVSGTMMTGYFDVFTTLMRNSAETPNALPLETLQANNARFIGLAYLIGLLSVLGNGLATLAITNQIIATLHNQRLSLLDGIRAGLRRFLAYVGLLLSKGFLITVATLAVALGVGCLFFGLVFGVGGMAIAGSAGLRSRVGDAGLVLALIIGVILYLAMIVFMFVPAVYLSARWLVALPGLVDQRWGPIEALQKSWALTQGQSWRCIGYIVLLGLLYGVIYLSLLAVTFFGVALLYKTTAATTIAIYAIIGAVLPILWQPLSATAFVLLYYDLRVRQEGYDLNLRVQQLETELQPVSQT